MVKKKTFCLKTPVKRNFLLPLPLALKGHSPDDSVSASFEETCWLPIRIQPIKVQKI